MLQQILKDEPENIEALLFESLIYARLNNYETAANVMNNIVQLCNDKTNENGFHFLYRELKGQLDPNIFLEIYKKLAVMNDYSVAVTPLLASLLVDNGVYDEAVQYLTAIIEKDPDNAVNYSLLMYAYSLMNESAKGLEVLKVQQRRALY